MRAPFSPRLLCLCLLVGLLGPAVAAPVARARSPWTPERGHGYAQAALYAIAPYDRVITDSGDEFDTGRTLTDLTLEFYVEHGLTRDWTLIVVAPFKFLDAGDLNPDASISPTTIESGSLAAPGNLRLGIRRALARGDWNAALQLDVEAPTGAFREETGLRTGYDAWSIAPVLGVGRGTERGYWYAYAGGGWSGNDYSSSWRVGIEGGRRSAGGRWWWIGALEALQSFHDGDRVEAPTNLETGLYVNDQEVLAPVIKVLYRASARWGVQATVQGGITGNFVARSPFVGLALSTEY